MPLPLSSYQQMANVNQLNDDDLRHVLSLLLDHFALDLIRETTPDYTAYELRPRGATT